MGFTAFTVNTPAGDAGHVYAEDDAALFEGIFGKDGVLNVGSKMAYERTERANEIRIKDGMIVCGGHLGRNRYADYTDVTISNGAAGYKRNDIIVARFTRTGSYGTDTYTINVVSGTRTSGTPADPAITQEDVYASGNRREIPLYRVKLNGTAIEAIEPLFTVIPTIPELLKRNAGGSGVITIDPPSTLYNGILNVDKVNEMLGTSYDKDAMSYYVNVTAMNASVAENGAKIIATCYNASAGNYNIYFDREASGQMRINYVVTQIRE